MRNASPRTEPAGPLPRANPILYLAVSFGLVLFLINLAALKGGSRRFDFSIYYCTAAALRDGWDPYAVILPEYMWFKGLPTLGRVSIHPPDTPTFTLMTAPMAWVTMPVAYLLWFIVNMVCLAGSLWMLFGPSSQLDRKSAIFFSLSALAFGPLIVNIRFAQSQLIVMLGIILIYRLLEHDRDVWAGAILAVLGLLRIYPLVLGGYLIALRRWRAIVALGIVFVLGAALTTAILGLASMENFLHVIGLAPHGQWLSISPESEANTFNVSLNAFITRLLMPMFGGITGTVLALRKPIIIVADLAILIATFRATAHKTIERSLPIWVATMLLLTPVVWTYYVTLLAVAFGVIAVAARHRRTAAGIWRLAMYDYCVWVVLAPLLYIISFRAQAMGWHRAAMGELGYLLLLIAWIAARRFALEADPLPPYTEAV